MGSNPPLPSHLRQRPPVAASRHGLDVALADDEVAELLLLLALAREAAKDGGEELDDLVLRHGLREEGVQAAADEVAAHIHVVGAGGLANEADLAHGGPAARVWAASHADDDVGLAQAATLDDGLQAPHESREVPLRLGEGEGAGRQRHARHHVPPEATDGRLLGVRDLVLHQQPLHGRLLRLRDLRNQHGLVAGHAEGAAALELLGDLREANADALLHAADRHEAAAMPEAVISLHPAEEVAAVLEPVGALRLEPPAEAGLHLLPVPLRAVVLHGVLDAGVLAVGAVAEVALDREDRFADVLGVGRLAEAYDVREPGEGLLVVVREPEAAAHGDVETLELAALNDGDEPAAVCKDVDVVGGRYGHGDLELAGQVGLAVQGLLLNGRAPEDLTLLGHLLTVHQEYLVVSAGAGQAMVVDGVGVAHDLLHELAAANGGVGGAKDVAADVSASCDGVHARAVHGAHGVLDVALEHAVKLPSLAGRDLQRSVGVTAGDVVHGQPLLGGAIAAGQAHADHEAERVLDAEFLALLADVAVVLLVAAMELDELRVLEGHLP
eukprot:CAMPEP_0204528176 /NCGR_PEP_ID=MMETSP0661-20131031/9382_1 /ASSEMBLY_ACC=CAM_ASM_000606 /TAXON_ID=109239 /ORGANISM="Alexandrium margalefi, Strain AMGDE01CS-322" /LENGTH=554 /DNA_ID=CAMNT_0051534137 /DNA_START=286 /DNA_END=1947 /DNA_ORIENTATION=+